MEKAFFERLPGYALLRSLTQRLANDGDDTAWKPALVELEEALVPAGFAYKAVLEGSVEEPPVTGRTRA